MPCEGIELENGARLIVCTRGRRLGPCSRCGAAAGVLCDFIVKRTKKRSRTCNAKLCARCAHHFGADRDLCPEHANLIRNAAVPSYLLDDASDFAMEIVADWLEQHPPMPCPCPRDLLCDRCRADSFAQLRGVAARRGEGWADDLVRTIYREQPWPTGSEKMLGIARRKVEDIATDLKLREELAAELARYAERRWCELRRSRAT